MKNSFIFDGRTIPKQVLDYLRKIAVRAVREKGYSAETVIDVLGLSRSCIYTWRRRYEAEGLKGLETRTAPGAVAVISPEMEQWLRETVVQSTPANHGYDTPLGPRGILAELLARQFGVQVSGRTVSGHLNRMGLTYQKPSSRATEQDPQEVDYFVRVKFPAIQRQAQILGADIAFEDESGVRLPTHAGCTGGERGHTPIVRRTDARGGFNLLSLIAASGHRRYHVEADRIHSQRYIAFLRQVLKGRTRPLILLVDRASFHQSKAVRDFVRAHRRPLRLFFLPRHAPERNPGEHVWEEIKDKKIGRQPVKNKSDLKNRIHSALKSLQHHTERIISFFHLPETKYAAM